MRFSQSVFLALLVGVGTNVAHAQTYPVKPIRMMLPFAPGGPVDVVARLIQPKLQETLGQPVVIENRTGAGGNIGVVSVAKSPADGYTILVTSSSFAVNPSLTPTAGYDALKDFIGVANIATQPNLIIVHPSVPVKNLEELIKLIKGAQSGTFAYATPGSGTTPHLTGEHLFKVIAQSEVAAIHFRGAGPAAAAIVAGEPKFGSLAVTAAMPHIKAGKVRAVAISSSARQSTLPDVATFVEQGFPQVQDYTWVAMMVPAGTPPAIVQRLNDAVNIALKEPVVRDRLEGLAFEPVGGTSAQFGEYLRSEVARWAKVVKETGAKLE